MAWTKYDKDKFKLDDGSIIPPDKGKPPYFHPIDLERVQGQSGVKCYSIWLCEMRFQGNLEQCYALFGAKTPTENGAEGELMHEGAFVALSCPDFTDTQGDKEIILDLYNP